MREEEVYNEISEAFEAQTRSNTVPVSLAPPSHSVSSFLTLPIVFKDWVQTDCDTKKYQVRMGTVEELLEIWDIDDPDEMSEMAQVLRYLRDSLASSSHKKITDIIKERNWEPLPKHLQEDRIPTVSSENKFNNKEIVKEEELYFRTGDDKKDLLCLVDSAYDIIESRQTVGDYNKKLKKAWLKRAKELGAGPDW